MARGTHIDNCFVGQRSKADVQCFVHLSGCALEELAASADEERIASEDSLIAAVLHEVANTVLRVARSVHTFDGDVAQLEGLAMLGCLRDAITILATDNVQLGSAEL
jgi:hypothetical protein